MLQDVWTEIVDQVSGAWLANAIAVTGLAIAIRSALYTGRQARAAEAALERKAPVLEVSGSIQATRTVAAGTPWSAPVIAKIEGAFQTDLLIRNIEPTCGIRITGLRGLRGARFADLYSLAVDDGYGNIAALPPEINDGDMGKEILLELDLSPRHSPGVTGYHQDDVARVSLVSQRPLSAGDVALLWHWADKEYKR